MIDDRLVVCYQRGRLAGLPALEIYSTPWEHNEQGDSLADFPITIQSHYVALPARLEDVFRYAICFTPQEAIQIADKLYELASKEAGLRRLDLYYSEQVIPGEDLALTVELNQRLDYPIGLTLHWPGGAMTQDLSPYEARQLGLALLALASRFEDDLGG